MLKKITNEIKIEWKKNKVVTGFMGAILFLSILTYLKPQVTSSIWMYLSLSAINLSILGGLIFICWWFYMRKR